MDDYNPTTINGLIRELLNIFECRSYVGYTATPFANIFIPPHIDDERYGTDLFPRDFIYRAPRADQYIGAREFFGLGGEDIPAMRFIEKLRMAQAISVKELNLPMQLVSFPKNSNWL